MRNIKITFKGANPKDPLATVATVSVKAEIDGKIYGDYIEFDIEPSAEEICIAAQSLIEILQIIEEQKHD